MSFNFAQITNKRLTLFCVIVLELLFGCLFGLLCQYGSESNAADPHNSIHPLFGGRLGENTLPNNFYLFQDIHVVMLLGIGGSLLATSCVMTASLFMVVAVCLQWATLCSGYFRMTRGKIPINIACLFDADFACVSFLISAVAVMDRCLNPLQLIVMALVHVTVGVTNKWLGHHVLQVSDVGSSMFTHVFGAYFGMMTSFVLRFEVTKKADDGNRDEVSTFHSTIRTVILWLFWPSFNASSAQDEPGQERVLINTYFALASSSVIAFAVTLFPMKGANKINMIYFQNATLAGGVMIGTSADMELNIWGAILVGGLAGAISASTSSPFNVAIYKRLGIRDPWGVHSFHGIPGIMAGLIGAIAASRATKEDYGYSLYRQFPARAPVNTSLDYLQTLKYDNGIQAGQDRTALEQGAYQMAGLCLTLAAAAIGGLLTGHVILLGIFNRAATEVGHVPLQDSLPTSRFSILSGELSQGSNSNEPLIHHGRS